MSAAAVSMERWRDAQSAEQSYWDEVCADAPEFARTLEEKVRAAQWATNHMQSMPAGDWVEIGIGPLGVGCMQLMPHGGARALVGVEPLPLLSTERLRFPASLAAVVRACQSERYTHIAATGESTGLEPGRFGLAVCYNVLDHTHTPARILGEIARILRPRGTLLLGCDTVSMLSIARYHLWVKRRAPESIGVRAHPHRFRSRDLIAMAERAGFDVIADNRRPELLHELAGHAHRLMLLCAKRGAPEPMR